MSDFSVKDKTYHDVIATEYNAIVVAPRRVTNDWIYRKAGAHIPGGERMLDLGCGTGHLSLRFHARFKDVVAVDHSIGMLDQARQDLTQRGIKHVQLVTSDIFEFMERETRTFSFIGCVGFLHHLTEGDIEKVLMWCAKHLEPNGRIIISEPIKIPPESVPARVVKWNSFSIAAKMSYSINPTPPDEAPISLEFFRSAISRMGLREDYSIRSWEVFPQSNPPAMTDKIAIRAFNWLYGKNGNVFTTVLALHKC